jgi:hypothetical protein
VKVVSDRVSSGVESAFFEPLSEPNDVFLDFDRDLLRTPTRAPGPGLETCLTSGVIAPNELMDPLPRDAVAPGNVALCSPFHSDRSHHQLAKRHVTPPRRGVNDVPRQVSTMS